MTDVVYVMARDDAAAKELCKWIGYSWEGYDERDISDRFPDWAPSGRMQGGRPALRKVTKRMLAAALAALNDAGYVVVPKTTLTDMVREEMSMAQRMRGVVVEARRFLQQTRHSWNGPIIQADALLNEALTAACRTTEQREQDRGQDREALRAMLSAAQPAPK